MVDIILRFAGILLMMAILTLRCQHKTETINENLSGKQLALQHCTGCHNFVNPQALPKSIWRNRVLPAMEFRFGIFHGEYPPDSLFESGQARQLVEKASIYPLNPQLSTEDWQKITGYFLEQAPDSLPLPKKQSSITLGLPHFKFRPSRFSIQPPATSMVKILPETSAIIFGDGKNNVSQLIKLNSTLDKEYNLFLRETPIHYHLADTGVYLTSVGTRLYPSDFAGGVIEQIYSTVEGGKPDRSEVLIKQLQRPVHVNYEDLNQDGLEDILVCEFGYLLGKLSWYQNLGNGMYQIRYLSKSPGAISTEIHDVDGDGLPDILVLMAQGDEGIFLFKNSPAGFLVGEKLLSFSPLQGSSSMELVDWDQDEDLDIIYTAGDNADISPILKDYHGIYVFENLGDFKFTQTYFYHLNGAYKALARDYDEDGDIDIAAISFFPDYSRSPEEGFVYLQNDGQSEFNVYSFPEVTQGRWMVMDVNDLDQDGDLDIALGSFVEFEPEEDSTGLYQKWIQDGPSVVVLENTLR